MRDTFDSFGHLMDVYRNLKMGVVSEKTLLPKPEFERGHRPDARESQSVMEERYCLIGDVESFVRRYYEDQKGYEQFWAAESMRDAICSMMPPDKPWAPQAPSLLEGLKAITPSLQLIPLDCIHQTFLLKFCPPAAKFQSYNQLAHAIRARVKRGERIPKRLCYYQNIRVMAEDMRDKAAEYYISRGIIRS